MFIEKVEEPPMKQVKAPEKKVKQTFAESIQSKITKKKETVNFVEEQFPDLKANGPEIPKPKVEYKPATVVEE